MPRLLLLLLYLSQASIGVVGYCYTRNGTTILSEAYQPCSNSTKFSACCGTNHQGAGDKLVADDVCMDNGLCQNFEGFDGTNKGQQLWWRQGCTDPTWQSPYCLGNVCNGTEYAVDNAPVRNCGGNSWCCGEASCCNTAANLFQVAETVGPTTSVPSATSSSSTSGTASPTSTNTPATTSSRAKETTSGLGTGAKAGIGVGVAVVVILAIAVVMLLLRLRNSKRAKHDQIDNSVPTTTVPVWTHDQKYQPQPQVHEASGYGAAELEQRNTAELWANSTPQELDGRGGLSR